MKLFLTSQGLSAFPDFVGKDPKDIKIAFIPTAANPYTNKPFVERDWKFFEDRDYQLKEIEIAGKEESELERLLKGFDVIFLTGGNTFYLLEKIRESGFDRVIKKLVENGVIYAGESAGAIVAGPNIEPVEFMDHKEEAKSLTDYTGLGLIDFIPLPHYDNPKYGDAFKDIIASCDKLNLKREVLTDDQAIIVEDKNYKIIESLT